MKKNPEAKKVQRVTTGEVVRRKKPLGARLKDIFIGGSARSVWSYVAMDVLIPAAKDMVADAATQAVERTIFGESRRRVGTNFRGGTYTPYNRFSPASSNTPPWRAGQQDPREISKRARATHNFDEIMLESRGEAEEVLDQLLEIISQYQAASVADLYTLIGVSAAYTDGKYGWSDLRGASVSHVRGGLYLLNLPKPVPLD
jgi:hypothetical protein